MAIDLTKVPLLSHVKYLYADLRDRIKEKYTKPNEGIPASDLADGVVPVQDVQVNGTSIIQNGIANIPKANTNVLGLIKLLNLGGLSIDTNGTLKTSKATSTYIKGASNEYQVIVPYNQHEAVFYGLAKAAHDTTQKNSSNAVGTYTDAAKQGIQKMLGLDGLVGPYEADITADQAYAIGETFVMDGKRYKATAAIAQGGVITPGTNCELDPLDGRYVRKTDYADASTAGVIKVSTSYGVNIDANGMLKIYKASSNDIKLGASNTNGTVHRPIVPENQHTSVYYALAKLAGADMASASGETVGVYPAEQKAAIQTMIGVNVASDADALEIITQYPKKWEVSA